MDTHNYDTVSQATDDLRKRGFTVDFNLDQNHLVCEHGKFDITDFVIVETYRFEGNSDPSDEAIVYAIESVSGIKGILVNGYGVSSEPMTDEMAEKLKIKRDQ